VVSEHEHAQKEEYRAGPADLGGNKNAGAFSSAEEENFRHLLPEETSGPEATGGYGEDSAGQEMRRISKKKSNSSTWSGKPTERIRQERKTKSGTKQDPVKT
jgi:hypothetical protein